MSEELSRSDIDAAISVDGVEYRRATRSIGRNQTAAGEVAVERTLYRRRKAGQPTRAFAALDRNVGIVDGHRWLQSKALGSSPSALGKRKP